MTPPATSILVIDDDADALMLMRAALRKAGYAVRTAQGGEEGLAQFRAQPSDMVMLDVEMPGVDGYQVCRALRAEAGPLLPIVMVTGMDDLASVEHAYDCGATDFIAKPVNWAQMSHRVRYLFRSHRAALALQEAELRSEAILGAIPDLLFELDFEGRYLGYRAPREDLLATPPSLFLGRTVAEVLPPKAAEACMAALREADERGTSTGHEFELELPTGAKWFELSVSRRSGAPGEAPSFIMLSRDITERKNSSARIAQLAYYDSLTGLPNRRSFLDRADRAVKRAQRSQERLALLFIDLDGFKNINDTMGHAAGDALLQAAADRLREGLRPLDMLSRPMSLVDERGENNHLARLGGDEFTALVHGVSGAGDALAVADRIASLMRRPFDVSGRQIRLSVSVGIALYPEDGADAATLIQHADVAMYHAKQSGRNNAKLYNEQLGSDLLRRVQLEDRLRIAVERQDFHLVYQPQVDARTGRILKVEALLRWSDPEHGTIGPLEFIPLAEETGLIDRIGEWVLRTACAQAARWHRQGLPLDVSVNMSPRQFGNPGLADSVMRALNDAGLPAHCLEIEVTETVLMQNTDMARAALESLRAQGVGVAIDDFGTGYSSLAYLTRMPIGHLKIDRSFVLGMLQEKQQHAIVLAVISMSHSLGFKVTAEGVESAEQAAALLAMGCDSFQGFLFSEPIVEHGVQALCARPPWAWSR